MIRLRSLLPIALLALLCMGCSAPREVTVDTAGETSSRDMPDRSRWPPAMGDTGFTTGAAVDLEVGVVVFDDGIRNPDERDARDTLRSVEARLVATYLRDILSESGQWGPVRVLPTASQFAALTITGALVHSDGRDLVLEVRAVDASNLVWFAGQIRGEATLADYVEPSSEPFRPLFVALANRLQAAAEEMSPDYLARLNDIAALRYAAELAPDAFGAYLSETGGRVSVQRLPAESDPMLGRIERIRNQEALFIDTVDEQYVDLGNELGSTYRLWRQSSLEQAEYLESYTQRASGRALKADQGSFAAMQQVYSTYRSVRIQEQDLFELATGFDNETAPTVLETGENVVRLSGTLEQQYAEWRAILARIIRLEQGLP